MAYDAETQATALLRLATSRYDFEKVSADMGISQSTLRRWAKAEKCKPGTLPLVERIVERMLLDPPEITDGLAWAQTIGVLIDKHTLLQGKPTSRRDNLADGLLEILRR